MTLLSDMPILLRNASMDSQIDHLFDEAIRAVDEWAPMWEPACDVYEDQHGFTVHMALPGYEAGQIEVQVEDDLLSVKGNRKSDETDNRTWYRRGIPQGPFACSVRLPSSVDAHQSTASYKQGILTISFPKKEEAKPRRIMIEGQ